MEDYTELVLQILLRHRGPLQTPPSD